MANFSEVMGMKFAIVHIGGCEYSEYATRRGASHLEGCSNISIVGDVQVEFSLVITLSCDSHVVGTCRSATLACHVCCRRIVMEPFPLTSSKLQELPMDRISFCSQSRLLRSEKPSSFKARNVGCVHIVTFQPLYLVIFKLKCFIILAVRKVDHLNIKTKMFEFEALASQPIRTYGSKSNIFSQPTSFLQKSS